MPPTSEVAYGTADPAQAAELVRVLELHAGWEAQRDTPAADERSSTRRLQALQQAFEAYRSCRAGYAGRYKTDQMPELSPAGPDRLAKWCRTVRALLQRADGADGPVRVIAKAHRMADRIAARAGCDPVARGTAPVTGAGAVRELDAVIRWCDALTEAGNAAPVVVAAG